MGDIRKQAKYIPELSRYRTAEAAKFAWRSAWKRVFKRVQFWAFGVLFLFAVPASVGFSIHHVGRWLSVPLPQVVINGIVGGVIGGCIGLAIQVAFRKPVRRYLREDLVRRGVPICLACGYDLRGLSEARCPECGVEFDAALLSSDSTPLDD